jgi:hypothetical protein
MVFFFRNSGDKVVKLAEPGSVMSGPRSIAPLKGRSRARGAMEGKDAQGQVLDKTLQPRFRKRPPRGLEIIFNGLEWVF